MTHFAQLHARAERRAIIEQAKRFALAFIITAAIAVTFIVVAGDAVQRAAADRIAAQSMGDGDGRRKGSETTVASRRGLVDL